MVAGVSVKIDIAYGAAHLYCMCGCKAVQEVVECTVIIMMVQRWDQELIVYCFTVIHISEKMMGDVDTLTQRFGETFDVYLCVANIIRDKEELKHSDSYDDVSFVTKGPTRLKTCSDNIFVPVLTVKCIRNMS